MAKDLEAPKPFVPSGFADGNKLDAGGVEEMRFGLAGSGPLAKAVLDSNAVGTMRQLVGGGATPTTTIPVGTISPYAGTSAPANWLLCDGSAVPRNTYAALFDVTGTAYGAGDGSTTFNVPDLRGRVVAGKDNMGGTPQNRLTTAGSGVDGVTLGANGGTQTHTLTEAQIASHTHTPQLTAYDVSVGAGGYYSSPGQAILAARQGWANVPPPTYNGNVSLFQSNSNTGGGGAHQNTQPTIITTYIIKAIPDVSNTFGVALAGAAGGMLSGTYPNPSVASIAGLAAGGDLTGTYPNPTITNIANAAIHNSNTTLSFRTSSTERMSIDANGKMTVPQQPAFWGNKNSAGSAGTWICNEVVVNRGNHYNTGTGLFTCPAPGAYLIEMTGLGYPNPGYGYLRLRKNGSTAFSSFTHWNTNSTGWATATCSFIANCATSDTIGIDVSVAGGNPGIYPYQHNSMTIYFLG